MPYVSCQYAPENPDDPAEIKEDGHKAIICLDEEGRQWFLTEDSEVGDWLEYIAAGGTVAIYSGGDKPPEGAPRKPRQVTPEEET